MTGILVINCGSSSIKYSFIEVESERVFAQGLLAEVGSELSTFTHEVTIEEGEKKVETQRLQIKDHPAGFELIVNRLKSDISAEGTKLAGVGHRVVHGGEDFATACMIDGDVVSAIERNSSLAPLHNPANLEGIKIALEAFPSVPQVAVFDTSFHQTIPVRAYRYALPLSLYTQHKIRRYGFHGTSYQYVAREAAALLGAPLEQLRLIVLHLGNGASACAIKGGRSIDTSMGMTPLEGLVMGTRSGDLDPGVIFHLASQLNLSSDKIDALLNQESGLKGLAGVSDMRSVLQLAESGDKAAKLAVEITCYRIKKYIGAYYAILGGVDALVFTAGIGENSAEIRALCCSEMEGLGIAIDHNKNYSKSEGSFEITKDDGAVKILVVPTNEELEIALQTLECIGGMKGDSIPVSL